MHSCAFQPKIYDICWTDTSPFPVISQQEYQCTMGDQCCRNNNKTMNGPSVATTSDSEPSDLFTPEDFTSYDPTQEPIFPPQLQLSDALDQQSLVFKSDRVTWFRPTTLNELLSLKHQYPDARLVVGNTEVGRLEQTRHCFRYKNHQ